MARGPDMEKWRIWQDRVERFHRSGQTVAVFCAAEGVSQPSFYGWKKRLTDRTTTNGQPSSPTTEANKLSRFQAVEVASMPLQATGARATTVRIDGAIEIELGTELAVVDQVVQSLVRQILEMHSDQRLSAASRGTSSC